MPARLWSASISAALAAISSTSGSPGQAATASSASGRNPSGGSTPAKAVARRRNQTSATASGGESPGPARPSTGRCPGNPGRLAGSAARRERGGGTGLAATGRSPNSSICRSARRGMARPPGLARMSGSPARITAVAVSALQAAAVPATCRSQGCDQACGSPVRTAAAAAAGRNHRFSAASRDASRHRCLAPAGAPGRAAGDRDWPRA